jgi:hypothetical protein
MPATDIGISAVRGARLVTERAVRALQPKIFDTTSHCDYEVKHHSRQDFAG